MREPRSRTGAGCHGSFACPFRTIPDGRPPAGSPRIATVLGDYESRRADGTREGLEDALADWSGLRLRSTAAALFVVNRGGEARFVAATDSLEQRALSSQDRQAIVRDQAMAWQESGPHPAWHVAQPLGIGTVNALLTLRLSTSRLHEWASEERTRSYLLAGLAALILAGSVMWLTSRWIGAPLAALGEAMAGARGGARLGPVAPELGPQEFRTLARGYNELRASLADGNGGRVTRRTPDPQDRIADWSGRPWSRRPPAASRTRSVRRSAPSTGTSRCCGTI